MGKGERLNVGIVGAAGRGGSFRAGVEANGARVLAVCDIRADKLDASARDLGATEAYTDYGEMLDKATLDAVVVATPMPLHVPQSVEALDRGIHVMSEVPAAVSLEQCRALARAANSSNAVYMMAENYTYTRTAVLVKALAGRGLLGELYYAEGEYLHELKALNEITTWRRKWQTGIDGVTYGTHSLGPILQWMAGDRVARVCCEGSGRHYKDPRGDAYHQESPVMLCKTVKGVLIKIRVDMVSDRPHAMMNYQLQGTDGCFESSRGGPGDHKKIWFRELSPEPKWFDLDALMEDESFMQRYMPEMWRDPPEAALKAGHGGGDYFEIHDFVVAIRGESSCAIGVHQAMDMTLPGLVSQQSILQGGAWLPVPDSRQWPADTPLGQLHMVWPQRLLDAPPAPTVPQGFAMRQYRDDDFEAYNRLRVKAGFEAWTPEQMARALRQVAPDGFFLVERIDTGQLAASAMAQHDPRPEHPFGGQVGWVAADPEQKGKGLGMAVSAAAAARLIGMGYRRIYLLTDDYRLAALKTYLKLGFEPFMVSDDMPARWQAAKRALGWKA